MMTHTQIWAAIDRLAEQNGYSASGLARKAGLDPTSFNKSKRKAPDGKQRWPSTESISKILAATETTMAEFLGLDNHESASPEAKTDVAPAPAPVATATPRKLPLITDEQAIREEGAAGPEFDIMTGSLDLGPKAWALQLVSTSLPPYFQAGDIVIIDPDGPARAGDPFLIRRRSEDKLGVYRGQSAEPHVGVSLGRIMGAIYSHAPATK